MEFGNLLHRSRWIVNFDGNDTDCFLEPYFVIVHAHAPISDLYTTSSVTDRQIQQPGAHFYLPEHIIFCRSTFSFAGALYFLPERVTGLSLFLNL